MAEVDDSILNTVKKILGFEADYKAFDLDIITHINSTFFTLNQIGVGPKDGFMITGSEDTWDSFIGPDKIMAVKSYMALKVRLLFDPPSSSFVLESLNRQATEMEWRLNVHMEGVNHPWTKPELITTDPLMPY